jgi:uncharacterized membrane protein
LKGKNGEVPESIISYVLIGGLIASVAIEAIGILAYYVQSGGFSSEFTPQWQVTGPNFFAYTSHLLESVLSVQAPTAVMALGVVLLMLTSYSRVFGTLLYFAFAKNLKYSVISLFLFVVLTLTLLVH